MRFILIGTTLQVLPLTLTTHFELFCSVMKMTQRPFCSSVAAVGLPGHALTATLIAKSRVQGTEGFVACAEPDGVARPMIKASPTISNFRRFDNEKPPVAACASEIVEPIPPFRLVVYAVKPSEVDAPNFQTCILGRSLGGLASAINRRVRWGRMTVSSWATQPDRHNFHFG